MSMWHPAGTTAAYPYQEKWLKWMNPDRDESDEIL